LIPLEFELRHSYQQTASGILAPITLVHGDHQVELKARLDTGASDCLFDAHYADLLGIDVQSGFEKTYRTVAGSFRALGHEVTNFSRVHQTLRVTPATEAGIADRVWEIAGLRSGSAIKPIP
jgi:hypothetical protein